MEFGASKVSSFVNFADLPFDFGFGQSLFDFYNRPLDERLFEAQRKAISRQAEKGNCVIVGRNANYVLKEFDHKWYESIIAFCTTSLLSMVALSRYEDVKEVIKSLKSMNVFPLHDVPWIPSAAKKVSIINMSPRLFCWLLHVKDKKR